MNSAFNTTVEYLFILDKYEYERPVTDIDVQRTASYNIKKF